MTVVGVDAGGTTTRALALDADGHCRGEGRSGPGNPVAVGPEQATASIVAACVAAVDDQPPPEVVLVALAGASTVADGLAAVTDAFAARGWTPRLVLRHDVLAAYFSATTAPTGAVLVAGTGAVGAVVGEGELTHLVDGAGWLLGDDGAGYWIGRRVAHDVLAAIDGRGPTTALVEAVMAAVPVTDADHRQPGDARRVALVRHVMSRPPINLAQLAPLAFTVDDPVARRILDDAADALTRTVDAVACHVPAEAPVVVGGSIATRESPIADRLAAHLGERLLPAADGLVGAGVLALRAADCSPDEQTRQTIASTRPGRP